MPSEITTQYTAGLMVIVLEGRLVGLARAVQGGNAYAEVVTENPGADGIAKKHLGTVSYEPIVLKIGMSQPDKFYDWIAAMLGGKSTAKDGAVIFCDYDCRAIEKLEFYKARITEVSFPTLALGSNAIGSIAITIAPESTRRMPGGQNMVTGAFDLRTNIAKSNRPFREDNFRLTIPGLDCSQVTAIEALSIKQPLLTDPLKVPDLIVTAAEAYTSDFYAWHKDFVINGINAEANKKNATLEFLPGFQQAPITLSFAGVGIHAISQVQTSFGAQVLVRVRAEMHCEQMSFTYKKAAPVPAAPPPEVSDVAVIGALRRVLSGPATGELSAITGAPTGQVVAARLAATVVSPQDGDALATDVGPAAGRRIGGAWAEKRASLPELEEIAAMDRGEWDALSLSENHSLLDYLQSAGAIPAKPVGPLTMRRDPFVEGIVEGASRVFREARPHLPLRQPSA